jgi:ribosomal protein S18 acetylase RimI-like enzyme
MRTKVPIRSTEFKDLPEILVLYNSLHAHHRELKSARDLIALADTDVTGYFRSSLEKQIADPSVLLLTALDDESVCGFVRVTGRIIEGFTKAHAYIDPLIVSRDARGRGIGTQLLRQSIEWSRRQGYSSIWLDVWEENIRARMMYEREGFRYVARTMAREI